MAKSQSAERLADEFRAPSALKPYARNARQHSDEQVAQLVASYREFGFVGFILIDDGDEIIAGHGRQLAALRADLPEVPVKVAYGWSEAKKRRFRLLDNKVAENSTWDEDLLALELGDLQSDGIEIGGLGFTDAQLADLLLERTSGETDADDTPEPPADPVSQLGDVWILGNHRIICGDSTDPEAVTRVLAGAKPHLMVTDPPYGVKYEAGWRNAAMPAKNAPGRWKDGAGRATGQVLNDDKADWREAWALFPGEVAYIWHAGNMAHVVADSLLATDFEIRSQIIWAKSQFVIGRGHYHPHHEPCWYGVRKGGNGHWQGDRKQSTLWLIDKPKKSETGHSTQKPVECMKRPIENNSQPGDFIYEPFSGSGTTIIAGEMTARNVRAVELNPAYVDVAVKRWEQFTGKTATHEETGETFTAVKARRSPEAAAA